MTPSEYQWAKSQTAQGAHERRMIERERFGSPFAADLFQLGCELSRAVAAEVTAEGRTRVNTRIQRHE